MQQYKNIYILYLLFKYKSKSLQIKLYFSQIQCCFIVDIVSKQQINDQRNTKQKLKKITQEIITQIEQSISTPSYLICFQCWSRHHLFSDGNSKYDHPEVYSKTNKQSEKREYPQNDFKADKNKTTTQLRLYCSQKQHMSRFYNNPTAIIKLRTNNQYKNFKNSNGLHCYIWINMDEKLNTLFKTYKRQKIAYYHKTGRITYEKQRTTNQYLKSPYSPSPTPPLDDSEFCLKTLVGKIENMIKFDYELGSGAFLPRRGFMSNRISNNTSNIMIDFFKQDHTNTDEDSKKSHIGNFATVDSIFGEEGRKISEISCTKQHSNIEHITNTKKARQIKQFECDYKQRDLDSPTHRNLKKDQKKDKKNVKQHQKKNQNDLYKLQVTQPVCFKPNNINDQYGILRQPPPENMFKRKNTNKNSKKKNSLQSSNSANKLSSSPMSSRSKKKKESTSGKKTTHQKNKQCPYQNPNDQKNRKKQQVKYSSTRRYHANK